jgi:hypothetical protein
VDTNTRLAVAAVFTWLGMVLAISFVEAPLKFRAPGVTLRIGLGIGRLVFRALNVFEYVFVVVIAFALFTHETAVSLNAALFVAAGSLLAQTVLVRPLLTRRTEAVLDGEVGRRSSAHYAYVALELVKVVALIWTGVLLVGTS